MCCIFVTMWNAICWYFLTLRNCLILSNVARHKIEKEKYLIICVIFVWIIYHKKITINKLFSCLSTNVKENRKKKDYFLGLKLVFKLMFSSFGFARDYIVLMMIGLVVWARAVFPIWWCFGGRTLFLEIPLLVVTPWLRFLGCLDSFFYIWLGRVHVYRRILALYFLSCMDY